MINPRACGCRARLPTNSWSQLFFCWQRAPIRPTPLRQTPNRALARYTFFITTKKKDTGIYSIYLVVIDCVVTA